MEGKDKIVWDIETGNSEKVSIEVKTSEDGKYCGNCRWLSISSKKDMEIDHEAHAGCNLFYPSPLKVSLIQTGQDEYTAIPMRCGECIVLQTD
jgi:hypothetical protein